MHDTAKYLIHANITADGVVERSDVVGAIFGQTEGLLGDELDLRDLQDASRVGRIDVEINSRNGQSFGSVTIATSLDKVETAILGAALETIDRIGPCRSRIEVERIEDVRAARRREVVSRAKSLLAEAFDGSMTSSQEIVEEVRQAVRVEDIAEYEGLPAGPNVPETDAVVVVEGRADVLQLLSYGIKNAVAVEGTNVPDPVAALTRERTTTAFFDGDRGGELVLKELAQVGDVDYVAFAPAGRSVEDLSRAEVTDALREKVPYERVASADGAADGAVAATDGSATPAPSADPADTLVRGAGAAETDDATGAPSDPDAAHADETASEAARGADGTPAEDNGVRPPADEAAEGTERDDAAGLDDERAASDDAAAEGPQTLGEHVRRVVGENSGRVRLLDESFDVLAEGAADEAFDLLRDADPAPTTVVLDGELTQRLLDVAAQRGVEHAVARDVGEFVKRPASVRVQPASAFRGGE